MTDKKFWDDRYAKPEYVYGTEANSFLVENAHILRGPVLSLSEGEGRNAVYLASQGLDILGVDISERALEKARQLAALRQVSIRTVVADLNSFVPEENSYGAIVSIFAHLPSSTRNRLYPLLAKALRPEGVMVLEAYSLDQLSKTTGGPKDPDMLMSADKIRDELSSFEPILLEERERDVVEGEGHTGIASVVQFIGRKR